MKRVPSRAVLAISALALIAGCSNAGSGSGEGFVSGDGSVTVIPADERTTAPVLAGDDLDGRRLSSADFAGQTLVINVWGSWCAPCRTEAPALKAVSDEYTDRDVQFIGILTRDQPASALAFNRKYEIAYPSIDDPSGRTLLGFSDSLPSQAIPTTWIIDSQGRVAVRALAEISESTLSGLLDDVLAESS